MKPDDPDAREHHMTARQGSTLYKPKYPYETHPFLAVRVEYIVLGLIIPIVT